MDFISFIQPAALFLRDYAMLPTLSIAIVIAVLQLINSNLQKDLKFLWSWPMRTLGMIGLLALAVPLTAWIVFCILTGRDYKPLMSLLLNERFIDNLKIDCLEEDPAVAEIQPRLKELKQWVEADEWDKIHDVIREADQSKAFLPNGQTAADLYVDVALKDIRAFEEASETVDHGISLEKLAEAVKPFHKRYLAAENDYVPAALAAKAHLIAGWAARGGGDFRSIPKAHLNEFLSHCNAAEHIFKVFPVQKYRSPLMAATQYRLCSGSQSAAQEFRARFAIWQQLNPLDPTPYSDHGNFLLPRWFGSYEELEDCARFMMQETKDQFGAAAYMLMYRGASIDEHIVNHMDVELFVEGAIDFAQFKGTQRAVNVALDTLHDLDTSDLPNGTSLGQRVQEAIRELTCEYLVYVLPEIWAYRTQEDILWLIAGNWFDELKRNAQVLYTPKGVQVIEPSPT